MLRSPYSHYDHLYVYHLDLPSVPGINDPDLIGAWLEDESAVLFFHKEKEALVNDLCLKTGCKIIYQADLSYEDWESRKRRLGDSDNVQ